jgi:hypothetical protein
MTWQEPIRNVGQAMVTRPVANEPSALYKVSAIVVFAGHCAVAEGASAQSQAIAATASRKNRIIFGIEVSGIFGRTEEERGGSGRESVLGERGVNSVAQLEHGGLEPSLLGRVFHYSTDHG